MIRRLPTAPLIPAAILAAGLFAHAALPAAAADVRLFRPVTADPRESQSRWRMSRYTEDWRYGTDIADSTSTGGVREDHEGVSWEIAAGEVFRWRPLERIGRWRGPWVRYQLGVPAGLVANFDTGALLDSDYQFGVSFDALWRGDYDSAFGIRDFRSAVVTSRLRVFHRSTHLGDEYLAFGRFGRNQNGNGSTDPKYQQPPVKRVDLTYEAVEAVVSIERAGPDGQATLRLYGGGEFKVVLPRSWHIGGATPRNFTSPAARLGFEYRSAGNAADPPDLLPARALDAILRTRSFESEWIAAFDLRLAKPYNFASCDNPDGETERWTPQLWTDCRYGREYRRYAGSWHAMVGYSLSPRAARGSAGPRPRVGPEWIVALEWYRGYSPNGQFLDQRMRYRPRGYLLPSVTAHF
jgi:hypothetical protein